MIDNNYIENLLKRLEYTDSVPDFEKFWNLYTKRKVDSYSENLILYKKTPYSLVFLSTLIFIFLLSLSWFIAYRYSLLQIFNDLKLCQSMLVTYVSGRVRIRTDSNNNWRNLSTKSVIYSGYEIRTEKNSSCELQLLGKGIYKIDENSYLKILKLFEPNNNYQEIVFNLVKGNLTVKSKELKENETMFVYTSNMLISVIGTYFKVEVDNKFNTSVFVLDGNVKIYPILFSKNFHNINLILTNYIDDNVYKTVIKAISDFVIISKEEKLSIYDSNIDYIQNLVLTNIIDIYNQFGYINFNKFNSVIRTNFINEKEFELIRLSNIVIDNIIKSLSLNTTGNYKKKIIENFVEKSKISQDLKSELDIIRNNFIDNVDEFIKVKIESIPSDAQVYIDNFYYGKTPIDKIFSKGNKINIMVKKDGFNDFISNISIIRDHKLIVNLKLKEIISNNLNYNKNLYDISRKNLDITNGLNKKISNNKNNIVVENLENINLNFDKEIIFFNNKIYNAFENKLFIMNDKGKIIKVLEVGSNKINLSKPVLGDDFIILIADNGFIYLFNLKGDLLWSKLLGKINYNISPLYYDDYIYVPANENLIVLDKNGNEVDNIKTSSIISTTPLIEKESDTIIFTSDKGEIVSYDILTKTRKWSRIFGTKNIVSILANNSIIISFMFKYNLRIIGLNQLDGSIFWDKNIEEIKSNNFIPFLTEEKLVIINNNNLYVFNSFDGELLNRYILEDEITIPYLIDGKLLFGTKKGNIYCYNVNNNNYEWKLLVDEKLPISIVFSDNRLIYAFSENKFYKIINY